MEDRTELSPTGCNGVTRSALRAGAGPEVVPGTAGTPASPDGPPQVRFKVTAGQPARVKRDRRRTVSAASRLSDSTSPDDESLTLERRAPDGGWGWVVVAAAFTVNMIADGICFSFGVFFVEFLRYFGSSKSTTSWLGSIFLSLPLLLGPPASSVVDRLGCRSTTIAGALLSAAGFVLSYFVDSMELLFITFSVMPGIGLSLCYVSAVVIVAYYFERRRSLATGISVCGTGVGTFLFPPLVEHLIQEYGWRGSLLVLSGIFLNIAVCGMLMRDLDWTRHKNRERSSQMTLSADGDTASLTSEAGSLPDIQQLRDALQSGDVSALLSRPVSAEQLERLHSSALQLPTWLSDTDVPPEVRRTVETNRRLHELVSRLYPHLLLGAAGQEGAAARPASPLCLRSAVVAPPAADRPAAAGPAVDHLAADRPAAAGPAADRPAADHAAADHPAVDHAAADRPAAAGPAADHPAVDHAAADHAAADHPAAAGPAVDHPAAEHAASCDARSRPRPTADGAARPDAALVRGSRSVPHHQRLPLPPLFACDAEPSADYLRNLRLRRQSMTYRGAMLNIHRYRLRASSCPDIYRNSMITILSEDEDEDCWSCVRDVARMLQKMLDVSYFRLPAFTLFALSNFVLYMFYDVPYVYLADHAIGGGASDEEASMLISVIGISNVVGVLLIGYLGDQPPVSSTALYVACMLACGVATLVVPSCRTYSALVVVSSVFGFCISANYTLAPTILVDLISIENFTNAYGILLLVQGLANLIGPPLCGMLHDLTASYALTFRSAGAAMAVSGLLLCVARAGTVSRRLLRRTAAAV